MMVRIDSVFCVVVMFFVVVRPSSSLVYPSVQWTPRNPIFQSLEITRITNVQPMSKISIICPNLAMNVDIVQTDTPKEWLYENLWIVSKKSYLACNASSPTDRLLLKCDTPLTLKYYKLVFQQFSATTQGLEFPLGKEYYFIATSDGTKASLDFREGGNCRRGSMKTKFYVCKGLKDPRCIQKTTNQPSNNKTLTVTDSSTKTTKQKETNIILTKPTPKVVPSSPTRKTTTEENKVLQSDDPRVTLHPTLSSHTTIVVPVVTSKPDVEARLLKTEQCTHEHGSQPSWNVVIPLLIIIVILVIMNSFVICRLKQLHPKTSLEEDDLNRNSRTEKQKSIFKKSDKKNSMPVSV